MAILKATVSEDIKLRFRSIAKARGMSEAELMRAVINIVIGEDGSSQPIEVDKEKLDLARITVRMPSYVIAGAQKRAHAQGMATSRWIASLVQTNLTLQPVMTNHELTALRFSIRELAAVGRNINQITRAINQGSYVANGELQEALIEVGQAIDAHEKAMRELVSRSLLGWTGMPTRPSPIRGDR
ncbi:MAG TPA: plasmid mobilization relaxosome protein MobC, partial [Parasulfuritortus sp.]